MGEEQGDSPLLSVPVPGQLLYAGSVLDPGGHLMGAVGCTVQGAWVLRAASSGQSWHIGAPCTTQQGSLGSG